MLSTYLPFGFYLSPICSRNIFCLFLFYITFPQLVSQLVLHLRVFGLAFSLVPQLFLRPFCLSSVCSPLLSRHDSWNLGTFSAIYLALVSCFPTCLFVFFSVVPHLFPTCSRFCLRVRTGPKLSVCPAHKFYPRCCWVAKLGLVKQSLFGCTFSIVWTHVWIHGC